MKKTESDLGKYVFLSSFLLPNGMLDFFDIVKGTAAPQYEEGLLRTGIFGILERSRKIPAVASWLGDPARGRSK